MMIPKSQSDGYLWTGWGSDGEGQGWGLPLERHGALVPYLGSWAAVFAHVLLC